jgi:hypothetical protein
MANFHFASLVTLSLLFGFGCHYSGTSGNPVPMPLRQAALKVSENTLETTYSRADASATIMTIRGGARHPDFVIEPGIDSPYEFDYIVLDRKGVPLFVAFGGSEAQKKGWNKYLENPAEPINIIEHHADLFVARDAAQVLLADSELGHRFEWELKAMVNTIETTIREVGLHPPSP